jgi:hypothetical protein
MEVARAKGVELPPSKSSWFDPGGEHTTPIILECPWFDGIDNDGQYPVYNCDEVLAMFRELGLSVDARFYSYNRAYCQLLVVEDDAESIEGSTPIEALYNLFIAVLEAEGSEQSVERNE